jgi:hypothetical protein
VLATDVESLLFVQHVPTLRTLELTKHLQEWDPPADAKTLIEGVHPCAHLTSLRVASHRGFDSSCMHAMLSRMPVLRELKLRDMPQLESLDFLSSSKTLQHTLTSLALDGLYIPKGHFRAAAAHSFVHLQIVPLRSS